MLVPRGPAKSLYIPTTYSNEIVNGKSHYPLDRFPMPACPHQSCLPIVSMPQETSISTLLGISQALHASPLEKVIPESKHEPDPPETKLSMSREEYMKKQNELFKQLKKPLSIGLETNQDLTEMLELYMASLDEQVYNEVELQQRVLAKAEHISRSHLEILLDFQDDTDKYTYIIDKVSQLQTLVSVLEANYTDMCQQRNELDDARLDLKHKYAIELARRTRYEHMVKVLSSKVVALDRQLTAEQAAHQQLQSATKQRISELETRVQDTELEPSQQDLQEFADLEVDDKLTALFTHVLKLNNLEKTKESTPPQEQLLSQTLVHLENFKTKRGAQAKELVKSLVDQYEAREQELKLENLKLHNEREISVAKCERLDTQIKDKADEIQGLIDRSVSLILTDKQLRSQLVSQNDILKRYEQVIETSRAHIEQLTAENEALVQENEELSKQERS